MNIFFYAGTDKRAEHEYAAKLLKRPCFKNMIVLPGGSNLICPQNLLLRSGDYIILCAATSASIDAILSIHKKFIDFRVLLVLPDLSEDIRKKTYIFCPRYTTSITADVSEIEAVVQKMLLSNENLNSVERGNSLSRTVAYKEA